MSKNVFIFSCIQRWHSQRNLKKVKIEKAKKSQRESLGFLHRRSLSRPDLCSLLALRLNWRLIVLFFYFLISSWNNWNERELHFESNWSIYEILSESVRIDEDYSRIQLILLIILYYDKLDYFVTDFMASFLQCKLWFYSSRNLWKVQNLCTVSDVLELKN